MDKIKYNRPYKDNIPTKSKLERLIWVIFNNLIFQFLYGPYLNNFRIFILKMFGAKIGKGCKISNSSRIWIPKNLVIKDYVAIGPFTDIYNIANITLGNKVTVSQYSYLCTGTHNYMSFSNELITKKIIVEDLVWIAAGAFIGPGVKIGKGSLIGARSVVTKNCDSFRIYAGNPCKEIKKRKIN